MKTNSLLYGCTAVLVVPLLLRGQLTDNRVLNQSHIKQAGLAVIMYTVDFDDIYPSAQSTGAVIKVTAPYVRKLSMWWPVDGGRLLFNMALSGTNSATLEAPQDIALIYGDTRASDGRLDVCYAEGHSRRLSWADWGGVQKTLHIKLKKAAKPLPASLGAEYNTAVVPVRDAPLSG